MFNPLFLHIFPHITPLGSLYSHLAWVDGSNVTTAAATVSVTVSVVSVSLTTKDFSTALLISSIDSLKKGSS